MLETVYVLNFLGMIVLPVLAGITLGRKLNFSWKLFLAGGLTFIASQILHVPLVLALTKTFMSWGEAAYALTLGLLAGLFEETARYLLFKFFLKRSRSWSHGVFIGLGHGGTEAILLGMMSALAFANMLAYRNIDLATVPSIPADQLELARQQVAAYWALPPYLAILGLAERIFAICLHVALSVMVLHGLANQQAGWFWLAVAWHALVDAAAVFFGRQIDPLMLEGLVGVFAALSLGIVFWLRPRFTTPEPEDPAGEG